MNLYGNLSKIKSAAVFGGLTVIGFVYYFYVKSVPVKYETKKQIHHFTSGNRTNVSALSEKGIDTKFVLTKTDEVNILLARDKNNSKVLDIEYVKKDNLQPKTLAHANDSDFLPDPNHKFVPINSETGIRTFANVCLENVSSLAKVDKNSSTSETNIVIYDSKNNFDAELRVAMSASCGEDNTWPVTFRKGNVPSHLPMKPFPAYFVRASSPGNLFHVIRDTISGLYGVLRDTNRLNSTVKNQVYTRNVFADNKSNKNISTYVDLIRALGVRSIPAYHMATPVCYPYGVFGWRPVHLQELAGYFVKKFNYNDNECTKGPVVTFIERQYRKVTNMAALVDLATKLGTKTQTISLQKLSVYDQYVTIRCTDVLVGVQGAGLQWAMFMRPNRALIELYYDGWKPVYSKQFHNFRKIKTKKVLGKREGAQWHYLEKIWDKKKPYTEEEKKHFNSPKYMDSHYNISDFQTVLQEVLQIIRI